MGYDIEDLWIGEPADVDDDVWHVVKYKDGSVQFIHAEDHTQIWQDRVTVSKEVGSGRVEAHYVEKEDLILLALARNNRAPPENGLVIEPGKISGGWSRLSDEEKETVLQVILVEWTNTIARPVEFRITEEEITGTVEAVLSDTGKPPTSESVTGSEVLRFGVDALRSSEERYR